MAITPDNGADDLGLGRRVAEESVARLLNPDGSFNVQRHGRSFFQSLHLYHSLLTMSWPRFVGVVTVSYLAANLLFAAGYVLCGPQALAGSTALLPVLRRAAAMCTPVSESRVTSLQRHLIQRIHQ